MAIGLGVPCWSFGIQHLKGLLPFEGAAQIVRALGFDRTAIGWAHIDWPALRADPIKEADRVQLIMEPLDLDIDDSFI
jgi:hypothetical protein